MSSESSFDFDMEEVSFNTENDLNESVESVAADENVQRSSTPINGPMVGNNNSPSNIPAQPPLVDADPIANLSDITADFVHLRFVNNVVPIGDGNSMVEAGLGNQNGSSMQGVRIMMNSISSQQEDQVENGPQQQGESNQQSIGGNEAQGQIGNAIEREQRGEECMASIELCLIQKKEAGNSASPEFLYMDTHLVNWNSAASCPFLHEKVEEFVRNSGDPSLALACRQNFGQLEKRAWIKFSNIGAQQFCGQLFRVEYGSERMKNGAEYTVHLFLEDRRCQHQSSVSSSSPSSFGFSIFVMDLHGHNHKVKHVNEKTKVNELKVKISEKTGIPIEQQRLVFFGKRIDQDEAKDLGFYKIGKNATIHLIMRLEGGIGFSG